jgi:predicted permease
MRHLRYALRTLSRHRSYTVLGIVTLGLAIGANTVVFSVARGLLLRPLPIVEPDRVPFVMFGPLYTTSFPSYRDFRARTRTFSDMAAYRIEPMALTAHTSARRVWCYLATGNYFSLLGVRPALGRLFVTSDDATPGVATAVVLSHAFWTSQFAADPHIIGQTVRLNDAPYTVIGVAPPEFIGTEVFYRPDLWIPMSGLGQAALENRFPKNIMVIGRLAPGVERAAAAADLNTISRALAREHPRSDPPFVIALTRPGLLGQSARTTASTMVTAVMALAALVLLAACANLGGLLASRMIDRSRDVGVRLALGASRGAIARDVLAETLMLAAGGTMLGYWLASIVLRLLSEWTPADLPFHVEVQPDVMVVAFVAAAMLSVAALAAVAAVRRAWRTEIASLSSPRLVALAGHRWGVREWLLAGQVAACAALLTASAVAIQSARDAAAAPIGVTPSGLSVVFADVGLSRYTTERAHAYDGRVLDAASRVSGVTTVALATSIPLSLDQSSTALFREDETDFTPPHATQAPYYYVSPRYFAAAGTRLLAGRDFDDRDTSDATPVAVVNETLARRVIGTADAVGRRFRQGRLLVEIVGIAEDGKYSTLIESPQPVLFRPRAQGTGDDVSSVGVLVRSALPPDVIVPQVHAAIAAVDPGVAIIYQGSASDMMAVAFLPTNSAVIALTAFALLGLLLTVTGVYGVAAFAVSTRTREIGIRVAIGARSAQVLRTLLGRTAVCVAGGAVLGIAGGVAAAQLLASVLYHATPHDPALIVSVVTLIALVALGATLGPARRALAVEPSVALREG